MRVHVGSTLEFITQKETSPGGSFKQGVVGGCVVVILRLYPQPSSHLTSSYLKARAAPPPILDHIPQTFTRLSELVMLLRWIKAPPPRGEPSCLGRKISQFNHNTRAGTSVRVAPRGCWQVDAGEEPRRGGAELQPLQANASWLPWGGGGSSPPLERGSWTPPSLPSLPEPAHPTSSPEQQPRILQLLHPNLGGALPPAPPTDLQTRPSTCTCTDGRLCQLSEAVWAV